MLLSIVERLSIIDADLMPVCHAAGSVCDARAQHEVRSAWLAHIGRQHAHAAVGG